MKKILILIVCLVGLSTVACVTKPKPVEKPVVAEITAEEDVIEGDVLNHEEEE